MRKKISERLISLFQLDKGDRNKNYGFFASVLSIVVNLVLFTVKIIFGVLLNSISLLADAFHALSDVITSVIVIIGFKISSKPPDRRHPFGHGRAERISAIILASILIVVGIEFFLNGLRRIANPIPIESNWLIVSILIISIIVKEFLSHISFEFSVKIGSSALKADAWHHRTDTISTVLVLLGFISFRFGFFHLDGILGIVIGCFIAYTGYSIIKESGSILMGEAPSPAFIERIKRIALRCEGVSDVHHIHVHNYGGKLGVTVHIRLNTDIQLGEAHKKASEVEKCIKEEIKGVEVTVHTEPEYDAR
jgi:cation diffusion facilitator family transporter